MSLSLSYIDQKTNPFLSALTVVDSILNFLLAFRHRPQLIKWLDFCHFARSTILHISRCNQTFSDNTKDKLILVQDVGPLHTAVLYFCVLRNDASSLVTSVDSVNNKWTWILIFPLIYRASACCQLYAGWLYVVFAEHTCSFLAYIFQFWLEKRKQNRVIQTITLMKKTSHNKPTERKKNEEKKRKSIEKKYVYINVKPF